MYKLVPVDGSETPSKALAEALRDNAAKTRAEEAERCRAAGVDAP